MRATVLRYRPEPYYGTHVKLHVMTCVPARGFAQP